MIVTLKRFEFNDNHTCGEFYVNGLFVCYSLEDKVRDFNRDGDLKDKGETKVFGETAIPYGKYRVEYEFSQKFKRILPRVKDVSEFEGILIHSANFASELLGCIAPATNLGWKDNNTRIGLQSRVAFHKLNNIMLEAWQNKDKIVLNIIDK